ncbi:uncharacterized protein BDZ99DRAFT_229417 [Mytilinidion resinicola]|uniref:DUF7137 domain-containing protein n=1 Tax=Mytilinidion resinicola TaxID=574789 RepID=A0A6A6YYR9_9PEZI|nr:uncharacterized protein BDZ99DRAFT_229417 [Mytilinidion resinicola]KAF2813971.1 hypothetical protein BDZ99DRAFT_229417 [Mytilinidion resinicola]
MRTSQLLATLLTFSSLSSAISWPDAFENVKAMADVDGLIYGRADKSSASPEPTASATGDSSKPTDSAAASSGESAAATTGGKDAKSTGKSESTGKSTGKVTGKVSSATGSKVTKSASISDFDPRLPAGGIQLVTPAALAGPQFYKIGDWVTFAWNYTSLSVTPTAVDILASCTANQGTYTLAVNQSTQETGEVLWDTGAYQATGTLPLLTETYTLMIYDADSSVSATPKAGYLAVYNQYTFGMYTPQPYTPFADFQCATCNAALSSSERQTLGFLLGMGTITVLSFGWFAGSFGLF